MSVEDEDKKEHARMHEAAASGAEGTEGGESQGGRGLIVLADLAAPEADPPCCQKRIEAAAAARRSGRPGGENGGSNGCTMGPVELQGISSDVMLPSSPSLASLGNDGAHDGSSLDQSNPSNIGNRAARGDMIVRCQGDDQMVLRAFKKQDTPADAVEVELRPPTLPPGGSSLVWIEAWCGMFMSRAVPVLVTTDVELACTTQSLLEAFRKAEINGEKVCIPLCSRDVIH